MTCDYDRSLEESSSSAVCSLITTVSLVEHRLADGVTLTLASDRTLTR
jgi:hypothetical protein